MHLRVTHSSRYAYQKQVYLEPHTFFLHPPTLAFQAVRDFAITVNPEPAVLTRSNDIEGNEFHTASFRDPADQLTVSTRFQVETLRNNPFDYVLYPFDACTLPFQYPAEWRGLLKPYLHPASRNRKTESFALHCANEARQSTLRFLMCLTENIYRDFSYEFREFGDPRPSEDTLRLKKGACRDFTILMMDCCRMMGIAARFASGYFFGSPDRERHLHAWVEIYLPGAGWRGYDPTEGIAVADRHILLASSAYPALVTPVQGSFRGDATASLITEVDIEYLAP